VVRVTNAVLPGMRERRGGRIINISSLAGLMGAPGMGYYSASKFALEGYTETLSLETARFGIKVSLVEPGFFKTNIDTAMMQGAHELADYQMLRARVERYLKKSISQGGDPQRVAELIVKVAGSPSPRLRYRVGNDAVWLPRLRALLPGGLFHFGMRKRLKL
jgi:NAD(P)-dependent dehydrogenase (short-subunit alcohol dehydrogenase family)